ncbi:IS110 family transposase [Mycobacterium spongiae]|uniref:Transposase n=1 Tax=Mycobacterium spongiae TaxID=886343 RepID=A0A975PY70_9MYCO|nr:transposase [Mycobacterium spongiae]QUR69011.1 transposase [Mycobacterium spongiae]
MTTPFCGIDWGESRHDAAIIEHTGQVITDAKIATGAAGFSQLLTMLAEAGDSEDPRGGCALCTVHYAL